MGAEWKGVRPGLYGIYQGAYTGFLRLCNYAGSLITEKRGNDGSGAYGPTRAGPDSPLPTNATTMRMEFETKGSNLIKRDRSNSGFTTVVFRTASAIEPLLDARVQLTQRRTTVYSNDGLHIFGEYAYAGLMHTTNND